MKKIGVGIIWIVLACQLTVAQSDPVKELSALCKTWGLLKYYHPTVQKGKVDWNRTLELSLAQHEKGKGLNIIVGEWLKELGQIKQRKKMMKTPYTNNETCFVNYGYLAETKLLHKKVLEQLNLLITNYRPRKNIYIKNEIRKHLKYGDRIDAAKGNVKDCSKYEKLRMFFTYWNIIDYFYPYNNKKQWDSVLMEYIPRIYASPDMQAFYYEFALAHNTIKDGHGMSSDPFTPKKHMRKYNYPLLFKYMNNNTYIWWVPQGFREEINLQPGSIVNRISHMDVNAYRDSLALLQYGARKEIIDYEIDIVLGSIDDDTLFISVTSPNGKEQEYAIPYNKEKFEACYNEIRDIELMKNHVPYRFVNGRYGYINTHYCTTKDLRKAFAAFKDLPAIIIDTRIYGGVDPNSLGGFISGINSSVCHNSVKNSKCPGKMKTTTVKTYPLGLGTHIFRSKFKGIVAVLIDENNISASEYMLFRLKALKKDAVFIGRNTNGSISVMYTIVFPNSYYRFSGDVIKTMEGECYQNTGFPPDIYVPKNLKSLMEGKDEIFEKAIEYLDEKIYPQRNTAGD